MNDKTRTLLYDFDHLFMKRENGILYTDEDRFIKDMNDLCKRWLQHTEDQSIIDWMKSVANL